MFSFFYLLENEKAIEYFSFLKFFIDNSYISTQKIFKL